MPVFVSNMACSRILILLNNHRHNDNVSDNVKTDEDKVIEAR